MHFSAIIAGVQCGDRLAIGNNGGLPWRVPEDLKWFQEYTKDNIIIMGRKTWESLPKKPLPGRVNIVMTSNPNIAGAHHLCMTINHVINLCSKKYNDRKCIVIGGSQIYKEFFDANVIKEISMTYVEDDTNPDESEFDTFVDLEPIKSFKQISSFQKEQSRTPRFKYHIVIYEKK